MNLDKKIYIDLHLHLDGSLSLYSARKLAKMQGIAVPEEDSELEKMLVCPENAADLTDYLKCFSFPVSLLQTEKALTYAVKRLRRELEREGLIYAEIRFAPQKHTQNMSMESAVRAAIRGLSGRGVKANLILCAMRDKANAEQNLKTLELCKKYLNKGVCALDLAGAEALYPTENFKDLFLKAQKENVPFVIHAGEGAGCESINAALELCPKRLGHGIRAYEDETTLERIKESDTALTFCPKSNLDTRIFSTLKDYPLRAFLQKGICVCVNTDNMTVSNTRLKDEYKSLILALELSESEVETLLLNSARATLLPPKEKSRLLEKLQKNLKKRLW